MTFRDVWSDKKLSEETERADMALTNIMLLLATGPDDTDAFKPCGQRARARLTVSTDDNMPQLRS